MKITYNGKQSEFSPRQQKKLDARFAKLAKLLDRREEKAAHVVLTAERHLQKAEINVRYCGNPLTAFHSDPDVPTAIIGAIEKLEKQILRYREKRRETHREPAGKVAVRNGMASPNGRAAASKAPASTPAKANPSPRKAAPAPVKSRVYKVEQSRQKPMTVEEALLEMESSQDYMVYRDAGSDKLNVIVRRRDGHFDLIES